MTDEDTPETRDQKYKRQTKESFEYLGRFVQAFELMINSIRTGILNLTTKGTHQQRLLLIILNHSSLTASPLFEIYRSLLAEIVLDPAYKKDDDTKKFTLDILAYTEPEFRSLQTSRNDMLHGTWHIGWAGSGDEDFTGLGIAKYKASAKGFAIAPTPKNIDEIKPLIQRCDELRRNIITLDLCFTTPHSKGVKESFDRIDKRWITNFNITP